MIECTTSDLHPYECDGAGKCEHCDRRETPDHDPAHCALCDPDYDHQPNEAADLADTPFRVYGIDGSGEPVFIAAADDVSLGDLLLGLHKSGRIDGTARIGIMYRPARPGEWLVNPFA